MADKLKVFTLSNLQQYDALIKGYVDAADARSLKTVAIDGNVLKFYRVDEPVGETAPAYEITLPETDVSNFIEKVEGAKDGEFAVFNADGTIKNVGFTVNEFDFLMEKVHEIINVDTGYLAQAKEYTDAEVKKLADGAVKSNTDAIAAINNAETGLLAQAKKYTDDEVAKTQGEVDALEEVVAGMYTNAKIDEVVADAKKAGTDAQAEVDALEGVVAGMYTNKQIDDAIATAKEEATYDDTTVKADIKANTDAIDDLEGVVGDAETLKTEAKTVVGAINEVFDGVEAHKTAIDETVTTLVGEDTGKSVREIANEELAAQLIGENAKESLDTLEEIAAWIQSHPDDASAMNKAIEDLEKLVGTLPEGITATTVVGYIQEVVAAEKTRAEGVESGLDTRLKAVEEAIGEDSVATQITDAIAELDSDVTSAAVEAGKGVQVQVVETDGKITAVNVTGNYDEAYDAKGAAATAESNAKTYADGLDTAMNTRVTSLETKVGEGFEAITEAEINALFA